MDELELHADLRAAWVDLETKVSVLVIQLAHNLKRILVYEL